MIVCCLLIVWILCTGGRCDSVMLDSSCEDFYCRTMLEVTFSHVYRLFFGNYFYVLSSVINLFHINNPL